MRIVSNEHRRYMNYDVPRGRNIQIMNSHARKQQKNGENEKKMKISTILWIKHNTLIIIFIQIYQRYSFFILVFLVDVAVSIQIQREYYFRSMKLWVKAFHSIFNEMWIRFNRIVRIKKIWYSIHVQHLDVPNGYTKKIFSKWSSQI